jgi:hypothetical protein
VAHNDDFLALRDDCLDGAFDNVCVVEHGCGREGHAFLGGGELEGDGLVAVGADGGYEGGVGAWWGGGSGDDEDGGICGG